jgi:hypothetical protein
MLLKIHGCNITFSKSDFNLIANYHSNINFKNAPNTIISASPNNTEYNINRSLFSEYKMGSFENGKNLPVTIAKNKAKVLTEISPANPTIMAYIKYEFQRNNRGIQIRNS